MGMPMLWAFLLLLLSGPLSAQEIIGGGERRGFEPGTKVLWQTDLSSCPVGEVLPDLEVQTGSYECARFKDRIWIRPLAHSTRITKSFDQPLPAEWSLTTRFFAFEEGCPRFVLRLIAPKTADPNRAHVGVDGSCGELRVGSENQPREIRLGSAERIEPARIYELAVQVRRGQIRFFLDGRRIAVRPFRPEGPIGGLYLAFFRSYEHETPFADRPVLFGDIRIAAYEKAEARPEPEKDLLAELGAKETEKGLEITLPDAILFDFGKWELKPEARETLEKLARIAELRPGPITIEGHTDNVGSEGFNRVLSELRAHAVALELARAGVDAKRLKPVGFGESRPVAPNDSEEGRAKNRRVVVVFAKP